MTKLVNQKTFRPTRKIFAVMVAGAVVGGIQAILNLYWPEHPFAPWMENIDSWVQFAVMAAAGYLTKEREVSEGV